MVVLWRAHALFLGLAAMASEATSSHADRVTTSPLSHTQSGRSGAQEPDSRLSFWNPLPREKRRWPRPGMHQSSPAESLWPRDAQECDGTSMFLGCQKGVRMALVPRQSGADATGVKTVTSFTAGQTIVATKTVSETLTLVDPTKQIETSVITVTSFFDKRSFRTLLPEAVSSPRLDLKRRQENPADTPNPTPATGSTTTVFTSGDVTSTISQTVFATITVAPNAESTVFMTTTIFTNRSTEPTTPVTSSPVDTTARTATTTGLPSTPVPPTTPTSTGMVSTGPTNSEGAPSSPSFTSEPTAPGTSITASSSPSLSPSSLFSATNSETTSISTSALSSTNPSTSPVASSNAPSSSAPPSTESPSETVIPNTSTSSGISSTSMSPVPTTGTNTPIPGPTQGAPSQGGLTSAQIAITVFAAILFVFFLISLSFFLRWLAQRRRSKQAVWRQHLDIPDSAGSFGTGGPATGGSNGGASDAASGLTGQGEVRVVIRPAPSHRARRRSHLWPGPPGQRDQRYSYLVEGTTTGETTPGDPGLWSNASQLGSVRNGLSPGESAFAGGTTPPRRYGSIDASVGGTSTPARDTNTGLISIGWGSNTAGAGRQRDSDVTDTHLVPPPLVQGGRGWRRSSIFGHRSNNGSGAFSRRSSGIGNAL